MDSESSYEPEYTTVLVGDNFNTMKLHKNEDLTTALKQIDTHSPELQTYPTHEYSKCHPPTPLEQATTEINKHFSRENNVSWLHLEKIVSPSENPGEPDDFLYIRVSSNEAPPGRNAQDEFWTNYSRGYTVPKTTEELCKVLEDQMARLADGECVPYVVDDDPDIIGYDIRGNPRFASTVLDEFCKDERVKKFWKPECNLPLHHKLFLISPAQLRKWGIAFEVTLQHSGDFMYLGALLVHFVMNLGPNKCVATNIVTKFWNQIYYFFVNCNCKHYGNQAVAGNYDTKDPRMKRLACEVEGCHALFIDQDTLDEHVRDHKVIKPIIRCLHCRRRFTSQGSVNNHQLLCISEYFSTCATCNGRFFEGSMIAHRKVCSRSFTCECGKVCTTGAAFEIHISHCKKRRALSQVALIVRKSATPKPPALESRKRVSTAVTCSSEEICSSQILAPPDPHNALLLSNKTPDTSTATSSQGQPEASCPKCFSTLGHHPTCAVGISCVAPTVLKSATPKPSALKSKKRFLTAMTSSPQEICPSEVLAPPDSHNALPLSNTTSDTSTATSSHCQPEAPCPKCFSTLGHHPTCAVDISCVCGADFRSISDIGPHRDACPAVKAFWGR
ncbi:hypothetical protein QAD02_017991 [Eretmocerus hayati]|uniref:Uncharacterized protein n=1 Tax=Eretmocerus hayati TaxID=131215 RepID=A0ACC2PFW6_9HYME|nr:hypothetical protein QAD02_017991 [Eretmocerus hayati]